MDEGGPAKLVVPSDGRKWLCPTFLGLVLLLEESTRIFRSICRPVKKKIFEINSRQIGRTEMRLSSWGRTVVATERRLLCLFHLHSHVRLFSLTPPPSLELLSLLSHVGKFFATWHFYFQPDERTATGSGPSLLHLPVPFLSVFFYATRNVCRVV